MTITKVYSVTVRSSDGTTSDFDTTRKREAITWCRKEMVRMWTEDMEQKGTVHGTVVVAKTKAKRDFEGLIFKARLRKGRLHIERM